MDTSDVRIKSFSQIPITNLFSYCVLEEPNLSSRKTMEDFTISEQALTDDNRWSLFCVLDGHGGAQVASYTKAKYPKILKQILSDDSNNATVEEKISQSIDCLNAQLFERDAYENGSTFCGVLLDQARRVYYTINIGDSRVLKVSSETTDKHGLKVEPLTEDHKVTNEREYKRIRQVHKLINKRVGGHLSVTRALGDFGYLRYGLNAEPDIFKYDLTSERHLIIATDGVWDVIDATGLQEIVGKIKGHEPISIAKSIVDRAVMKSEDNISLIVVSFTHRDAS